MIRTIIIAGTISAQGLLKSVLPDGRLEIDVDGKIMTGHSPSAV
jgi:hypothetical protein